MSLPSRVTGPFDMAEEHFMAAFTQHQRSLYGYVRALCPRLQDADEVFSRTSMALWQKSETFEPGTNFLAWACRIAEFEVLNYMRSLRRDRHVYDEQLMRTLARESAAYMAEADRRLAALRDCMEQLPQQHRQMIVERYRTTQSVSELATMFGRSVNSFSVTLHKIRKHLLQCISRRISTSDTPSSAAGGAQG